MNLPENLLYTDHDEWVRREGDTVFVGITDHAQDQLGELVHIEMPDVGDSFSSGEAICEVESVKAVAEVYAPCDGEVIAVNEDLEDEAEKVNAGPYDAWLVKLRVEDPTALEDLLTPAAYAAKVESA